MNAAELLADSLVAHGVDRVFCVPGESFLAVLDALHDRPKVQVVTCRHEGGAGSMAVADGKITGRPGVCFVSRGPGATNASLAVHMAKQDAAPLVLFVGQVARRDVGRPAFQEINYESFFACQSCGVWTVYDPDMLAETVARAFHAAQAGTPSPAVVVLPEDMLTAAVSTPVVGPFAVPRTEPSTRDVERVAELIQSSKRPLLMSGPALARAGGPEALLACAEKHAMPVTTSAKAQEIFPNQHSHYAGYQGFAIPRKQAELWSEADLVVAVGSHFDEVTTGRWNDGHLFPSIPRPRQPLVHVHSDPHRLGLNFELAHGVVCDPVAFLQALAQLPACHAGAGRDQWIAKLRGMQAELASWDPSAPTDGINFGAIVESLSRHAASDAIISADAGTFCTWLHRYFPFEPSHLMIGAVCGAMGIGVPGAVAAGLRYPGREVVALVGDGGFLMTGNELATAVQYGVPVKIVICNNSSYGTIRVNQEVHFPGRVAGTDLRNPDFAALAEAFGARGLTVQTSDDIERSIGEMFEHDGPVVADIHASIDEIVPSLTISSLRARAASEASKR